MLPLFNVFWPWDSHAGVKNPRININTEKWEMMAGFLLVIISSVWRGRMMFQNEKPQLSSSWPMKNVRELITSTIWKTGLDLLKWNWTSLPSLLEWQTKQHVETGITGPYNQKGDWVMHGTEGSRAKLVLEKENYYKEVSNLKAFL